MIAQHNVVYSRRGPEWLVSNLDALARLHTQLMHDAWNEEWSNDPKGTNPRTNSYALWRHYMSHNAVVFSADCGDRLLGVGVLLQLSTQLLELEWVQLIRQARGSFVREPAVGDWEFAMVLVIPELQKNGVFSGLAERRMNYVYATADPGSQLWVQTLADGTTTERVRQFYLTRGFLPAGELDIKGTRRVFLTAEVTGR